MDCDDLVAAEKFLDTAYSRADTLPGFRTFQIDTHALRLFLIIEKEASSSTSVRRFEGILEKLDKVISMTGEESHRAFTLRVINEIEPFLKTRLVALSTSERNALLIQMDRLIKVLSEIIEKENELFGDENMTLKSVERSKAILLKG